MPIYFQRLSGQQFLELVFRFANYVLSKVVIQKAKAFQNIEESIGNWSTTDELKTKVMDFEAGILQHDALVEEYTKKADSINEQIEANIEIVEKQLKEYAPYKSEDFLEKFNQYLEQKVVELSKLIENFSSQLNAKTNDSLSSIGTRDKLLITELEMVDQLAKFIKRKYLYSFNNIIYYFHVFRQP